MQKQTAYKGNLKGDALKHYKWKGRRKSSNVEKGPDPRTIRAMARKRRRENLRKRIRQIKRGVSSKVVRVKAFIRKLASGKTVKMRSFLRRIFTRK